MPRRYDYSRWDGTQVGFELDADDILAELTNDILYNGDVNSALRRMMQQGFRDQNDQRVQGMRELLEKMISDHSNKSMEEVSIDIERDKILTAEQAIEYGLIDSVLASLKGTPALA